MSSLPASMKRIRSKKPRKRGDAVFPIITLWELSVAMETRVLIRSGPKPNARLRLLRCSVASKKLTGHIGFGLSVHARVLKFHIRIPHGKIAFFFSDLSPFLEFVPLIISEWNLMHAISYEPCMLWFWNFIYGFLMEKQLTSIFFFLVRVISLSGVMPLWKNQNEILSAWYSRKVFELGAWNLVSW